MNKHKWHKEIKAWADGAEIEKWMLNDTWQRVGHPDWYEFENYRIKSQPKAEPAKEWVGLNPEEKMMIKLFTGFGDYEQLICAIEQELKEKNHATNI